MSVSGPCSLALSLSLSLACSLARSLPPSQGRQRSSLAAQSHPSPARTLARLHARSPARSIASATHIISPLLCHRFLSCLFMDTSCGNTWSIRNELTGSSARLNPNCSQKAMLAPTNLAAGRLAAVVKIARAPSPLSSSGSRSGSELCCNTTLVFGWSEVGIAFSKPRVKSNSGDSELSSNVSEFDFTVLLTRATNDIIFNSKNSFNTVGSFWLLF